MKKVILVFFFFLFTVKLFAQQFSHYNTGTLYDSFENPSQGTFTPDSSRQFASNFFVPNFNTNVYITGDVQVPLKTRLFSSYYDTSPLQIGQGKYNHLNVNVNAYLFMFKMFTNLNGNGELGFSVQTRVEGNTVFTDETIALLNGPGSFKNNSYSNIFNDNGYYQAYHQFGFSYREKINKQFSLGIKVSGLLGIERQSYNIVQSHIDFDKPNDNANLYLQGAAFSSRPKGQSLQNTLLSFNNPGAAISIGTSYRTKDGFTLQGNIKDVGFIHWGSSSYNFNFGNTGLIQGISTAKRETRVLNAISKTISAFPVQHSYTSVTNGLAELSVNKSFWLNDDHTIKYSPTLIASKQLFYTGFVGAMVNPVQYRNYSISLTTSYDDMKLLNFGGQFMVKSPNAEFFIGSERLFQTGRLLSAAFNSTNQIDYSGAYTGEDFFIGFSMKFGHVIEHPMNASTIPMGETKGVIGEFFDRLFKRNR